MSIRAVFFDLDGTLLDHAGAAIAAAKRRIRSEVPRVTPEALRSAVAEWFRLEEHYMNRFLRGALTFEEQRRYRTSDMLNALGRHLPDSIESRDDWFNEYLAYYEAEWKLFPDAKQLLVDERNSLGCERLGVITNGDSAQQRKKLTATGLDQFLSIVVISSEVGVAKPTPEIFATAAIQCEMAPSEIAYVGDRQDTDAEAASAAGLFGIWLDRNKTGAQPSTLPTIHSLAELPGLIATKAA